MMKTNDEQHPLELRIPMPWGYIAGCWYGDDSTRPLLALHGWQDNAGTFTHLAPLIAPHRSVLAIDLPGNGRSTHFPPGIHYHMLDFVSIIHRIVEYYKWTQVSLIGHSMGAALSFYYAALFPHKVDMVIAIDVVHSLCFEPRLTIEYLNYIFEKLLVEDERILREQCATEPQNPSLFEFAQLEQQLHEGSTYSVDLVHCKHLLERNVKRSEKHSHKYYFSCDRRIKYYLQQSTEPDLILELAKRIRNTNYLIIKSEQSHFLFSKHTEVVIEILRENNPNLERYDLADTKHHLHLNQPELVAGYVLPFLLKHPPETESMKHQKPDVHETGSMKGKSRL